MQGINLTDEDLSEIIYLPHGIHKAVLTEVTYAENKNGAETINFLFTSVDENTQGHVYKFTQIYSGKTESQQKFAFRIAATILKEAINNVDNSIIIKIIDSSNTYKKLAENFNLLLTKNKARHCFIKLCRTVNQANTAYFTGFKIINPPFISAKESYLNFDDSVDVETIQNNPDKNDAVSVPFTSDITSDDLPF